MRFRQLAEAVARRLGILAHAGVWRSKSGPRAARAMSPDTIQKGDRIAYLNGVEPVPKERPGDGELPWINRRKRIRVSPQPCAGEDRSARAAGLNRVTS